MEEREELGALDDLRRSQALVNKLRLNEEILRSRYDDMRAEARRNFEALDQARFDLKEIHEARDATHAELHRILISRQYRIGSLLYSIIERLIPVGSIQRRAAAKFARYVRRLRYRRLASQQNPLVDAVPILEVQIEQRDFGMLPAIASSNTPRVSIIIPAHNNWTMTLKCLWSIASDLAAVAYEVIVVNDASTDVTEPALNQISGLRVLNLVENQGFVRAVNAGAALALGELIVLLNNDVEVQRGWLDALVDAIDQEEDIGLVGSRLIYPNGVLQEAGGIIFDDASGWNYGRNMNAGDPAFTFPRDVDYCSGACVLVRRSVWEKLGGFDLQFAPAYYEDADLAFSIRKLGYRVVYEPKSVVVHDEGGSYGTDESPKKSKLMKANQGKFQTKWAIELKNQYPRSERNVRVASWRTIAGHVLVVDHQVPTFDQDAGSLRMFELLKILVEMKYAVTFIPHNKWNEPKYTHALEEIGIEVLHGHVDVTNVIEQLSTNLSLAILSRPNVAWGLLPTLRELSQNTKIIYDTVDLHFLREQRRAELDSNTEASRLSNHFHELELWLTNASDATFVVSDVERSLLLQELPDASIHVIPTIHREQHPGKKFAERDGILFVGGFNHPPNRDAVEWLTQDILPIVRKDLPNIEVSIVGSNPTDEIRKLAGEGVNILGWVADLEPLYANARLVVAPLRYGAGIKGKIGEAASYGVPVITTHVGAEGLHFVPNEAIVIANETEAFAKAIIDAYQDPTLWTKLAKNARISIARQCSPVVIKRQLAQVLKEFGI